jgi:hypothetical protein
MPPLIERLSKGRHRVEVSIRPERTALALKECVDKGYIHLKFIDTSGGTDLYVPLDSSDTNDADFELSVGTLRIVGSFKLDYVPVKCLAEIDLKTLTGLGHLELV